MISLTSSMARSYTDPLLSCSRNLEQPRRKMQMLRPSMARKATVGYLQNLPPEMIDLILEFAEWPLRLNPELGMDRFLADTENAGKPSER